MTAPNKRERVAGLGLGAWKVVTELGTPHRCGFHAGGEERRDPGCILIKDKDTLLSHGTKGEISGLSSRV